VLIAVLLMTGTGLFVYILFRNHILANEIEQRRKIEEELQNKQKELDSYFTSSLDLLCIADTDGHFRRLNPEWEKALGYSLSELEGKRFLDFVHSDDIEATVKVVSELAEAKEVLNFVNRYRHKDGSYRFIEWRSYPVGKMIYAVARDITKRKQTEETIMLDESRLEALLQLTTMEDKSLNEIIDYALEEMIRLTKSEAGYLAFTNKDETILTMYSWSKKAMEECRLRYNTMICPIEQTGLWTEPVRQRKPIITNDYSAPNPLKKGYPKRHFKVLRHVGVPIIEGNHVVMIAGVGNKSSDYDESDVRQMTLMMGGLWKIVQRRKTEEELRESRRRLSDIIEFLPDATLVIDKKGEVIAWNRSIEAMTGVKAEEMLGKGNYEYALPFYGERRPILIDLALHPDLEREKEYTALHRSGDIIFGEAYTPNLSPGNIHLSATASVLRDSSGEIIAAIECIRNNTERKRLEAQLQQAQKMQAIGTLAGGIAHDFNNLLMAIQGNTSLMLMKTEPGDPRYERLISIEDQVVAGAALTKQILGFARVGKYYLKPIDLNDIIEKSSGMFGRTKKEILIHKKYEQGPWAVEADASQMEQVFLNLYVNAWQAMPKGGHLYLETANMTITEADKKSSYVKPGRYVKISITDTGVGMDEKTKERIFEPFFTTKEMGRGTGLGLAMVYGIVKGHNGYINVYSEEGKGTTFNIYLPVSEKEVVKEQRQEEAVLTGKETILLIDDEETIISVMQAMLTELGYQVLTAKNGRDALKIYETNKKSIDLVILDMIMPEMGGGETFNRLKMLDDNVKVILSSGYSLNGEAAGIMALGCKGFIQKPATMAELSQKIRDVLEGREHLT
jgi:PAS domain S-box-containing protein